MRSIDARRLTREKKDRILERDANICAYCLSDAEAVDHIFPWSYRHDDREENLVAACWLCNSIASNKLFDTFAKKKKHILERREKIIKDNRIPIWLRCDIEELGRGIRSRIEQTTIVADDVADAARIVEEIEKSGLEVIMEKGLRYEIFMLRKTASLGTNRD